ncbi:protein kinase family protein [Cellulosimicrobium sp. NPDC057127]|uniref:protein kinase family protein n=1 Tax=Cellulosimicrobium sp. NPDC057127 TaxID=3346026 RepID=UPI003633F73C
MNGVAPGTLLVARYRLDDRLTSDLADVTAWSAHDQILDRPVRVSLVAGPHVAEALDSARRAALVADPRLTRVLDVGSEDGVAYVVTEPFVGTTLTDLVAGGVVDPRQARAIVGEAAAALEVARGRGVHHLALRPDAVRVDGSRVVVTGLGLDAGVAGQDQHEPERTSRLDAVGLVSLFYYATTARWPGPSLDVPWVSDASIHPLPALRSGDGVTPPSAVRADVPPELDALCVRTFASDVGSTAAWTDTLPGDGPRSPADVVEELQPWGEVSVASLRGTAQQGAGAGVNRQSVRSAFDRGAAAAPPGTPPPAPPVRRPSTGRIHRVGEVPGSAGAAVPQTAAFGAGAYAATDPTAAGSTAVGTQPVPPPPVAHDAGTVPTGAYAAGTAGGSPGVPGQDSPGSASGGEPPRRGSRRFNATPVVLVLVLLLVGAGVVWAVNTAFSGFDPAVSTEGRPSADADEPTGEETPAGEEEPPPAPEPAPDVRPAIASGTALDPQGDENPENEGEHPELAALAYDGQPETAWYSRRYNTPQFAGLKDGFGYAITLEQAAPVQTVVVDTSVTGGNVEIRATSPDTPTEGEVLASGPLSPGAEFTFPEPVEAESIVLWFTELPQNGRGENRVEINELLVS